MVVKLMTDLGLSAIIIATQTTSPQLSPISTVKIAVADGFGDVLCADLFGTVKVGNGSGYFEDALVGAG